MLVTTDVVQTLQTAENDTRASSPKPRMRLETLNAYVCNFLSIFESPKLTTDKV